MALFWFLPVVVGLVVVWGLGHPAGAYEYRVSFWRALIVALLFRGAELASTRFLGPVLGDWEVLVALVAYICIARGMLWLSMGRSVAVGVVYSVALVGLYFSLGLMHSYHWI